MKMPAIVIIVLILGLPASLPAFQDHVHEPKALGSGPPAYPLSPEMRSRLKLPVRLPQTRNRSGHDRHDYHPARPDHRPGRWSGDPHRGAVWPATTVVREVQPIVIVNQPPAAQPPAAVEPAPTPEPDRVWVPPVTETRTVPGYWDYAIRKRWMGDHWRFEQDFGEKTWVPESEVTVVKQEGYWKRVE